MNKLSIFYVITELHRGGAEKNLSYLARSIKGDHRVTVVCLYGDGEVASELRDADVEVRCLGFRRPWQFLKIRKLARMIRDFEPDIVHTFLIHANIAGRIAARLAGARVAISSVRVAERERSRHLAMDRWTNGLVKLEICNSEAVRTFMIEEAHIVPDKLVVIPNGIEVSDYEVSPVPAGPPVITLIGRLHAQKGVDILIRAATRILRGQPDAVFRIVGSGPERGNLEDMAVREGVGEKMEFTGFVGNVREILRASSVLVLPSRWEGMPNVALEAMACGRPVVASDVDGCGEVVNDGETGTLVPPEDPGALADAVLRIAGDRDLAGRMGRAGRERVERRFTVTEMVRAHEELYGRCVESTRS